MVFTDILCFRYTAREIREALFRLFPRRHWNTRDAELGLIQELLPAMNIQRLILFENHGWAGAEPDMYGVHIVRYGNARTRGVGRAGRGAGAVVPWCRRPRAPRRASVRAPRRDASSGRKRDPIDLQWQGKFLLANGFF